MSTSLETRALPLEGLKARCRSEDLPFGSTAEVTESDIMLPQERALSALELGVQIASSGHNVFVMGAPGSGRHAAVRRFLQRVAAGRPSPDDWCYLNRFDDPQRPRALRLPAGTASELKRTMRALVRELRGALAQALESDAHRARRTEVEREFEERSRSSIAALQREAEAAHIGLIQTPEGFAVAPLRDQEILPREVFEKLTEAERTTLHKRMEEISEKIREHFESVPRWDRDRQRRLRELDRAAIASVVRVHIEELRAKYAQHAEVLDHLLNLETDLAENASSSLRAEQAALSIPGLERAELQADITRYDVNVLIDGRSVAGAPVVYEPHPTYQNLIGQIENVAQFGTLRTDFTLVRPGALHRANGGFLMLDAERLLSQPFAWEALKYALFERCIRIEPLGQHLSLISTLSLEPDRIPLSARVVLIGTRQVYELLSTYDPEFRELFKIAADFDDHLERTAENTCLYARAIAAAVRREGLEPFEAEAVARLIEHASRLAGDSRKLSTHVRSLDDAVREAHHFAAEAGQPVVRAADVQRALDEQHRRLARSHREMLDAIRSEALLIDLDGEAIGQINGLSVIGAGPLLFASPVRITAAVRIGEGEVVDIEREAKLGGAIHSKGVMILSALIGARFGIEQPLSLHASLVFEQTYGGVEGDSASLAEACALLSAIAGYPLRQSLGVTGSINQRGTVQVIGSVNEKIEGFFDACRDRGLGGSHGVIIPAGNVPHLMLRDDVIAAAERGRFQIYAVRSLDQALELLTGMPCGDRGAQGQYPADTFSALVERRLGELARARSEFARKTLAMAAGAARSP